MRMGGSPMLLVGAIVLLAALDFVGSVLAEVVLPNGEWAAIVAILALQAYLVLAPNREAP